MVITQDSLLLLSPTTAATTGADGSRSGFALPLAARARVVVVVVVREQRCCCCCAFRRTAVRRRASSTMQLRFLGGTVGVAGGVVRASSSLSAAAAHRIGSNGSRSRAPAGRFSGQLLRGLSGGSEKGDHTSSGDSPSLLAGPEVVEKTDCEPPRLFMKTQKSMGEGAS